MLLDEAVGVGVIGGDDRLTRVLLGVGLEGEAGKSRTRSGDRSRNLPRGRRRRTGGRGGLPTSCGQAADHAFAQLSGGLVGEGQSKHLVRLNRAGAHEPDHARGHHRRLAGARARDDHPGFERRGDRGQLLLGVRDAEQVAQFVRSHRRGGQSGSSRPSGWRGQALRSEQCWQTAASPEAWKRSASTVPATSASSFGAQPASSCSLSAGLPAHARLGRLRLVPGVDQLGPGHLAHRGSPPPADRPPAVRCARPPSPSSPSGPS